MQAFASEGGAGSPTQPEKAAARISCARPKRLHAQQPGAGQRMSSPGRTLRRVPRGAEVTARRHHDDAKPQPMGSLPLALPAPMGSPDRPILNGGADRGRFGVALGVNRVNLGWIWGDALGPRA